MRKFKSLCALGAFACLALIGSSSVRAQQVQTVFVIAMENHNWTEPANQFMGEIKQIYKNKNAPLINILGNGKAVAIIKGSKVNISQQVAYATAYHNVLATPNG